MRLRMMIILTTLMMILGCSSSPNVVPVLIPPKHYSGTVKRSEIIQCPRPVQISVYMNLRKRDQYIETLLDVIHAHNGASSR